MDHRHEQTLPRDERKNVMSRILACFFMVAVLALAQQSGAVVNADGTVTFTLKAPQAQNVVLNGDFPSGLRNIDMQRNELGEWKVTTSPLPRGSCYFRFVVDG